HRRRPAERRLARRLRARGDGTGEARRRPPRARCRRTERRSVRRARADRVCRRGHARRRTPSARRGRRPSPRARRAGTRLRRARARQRPRGRPPARHLRWPLVGLSRELKRLGTQSAIYGLGGDVSRLIAVFLIPVYTVYLGRTGFGKIETIVAMS